MNRPITRLGQDASGTRLIVTVTPVRWNQPRKVRRDALELRAEIETWINEGGAGGDVRKIDLPRTWWRQNDA